MIRFTQVINPRRPEQAIAVAAAIPGTLVHRIAPGDGRTVRFGHPSGSLAVGAQAAQKDGSWTVTKVVMSRSARRLMEGVVLVPDAVFSGGA